MNYKRTQKHRTTFPKSYLTIPVFLGVLALTGQVSADETEVLVVEEPRTQVEPVAAEVVELQEATEEATPLEAEEVVVETPVATEDSVEEVVTEQATEGETDSSEQTETVTEEPTVETKPASLLESAVPEVAEETSTEVSVENAEQTPVLGVTDSGETVHTYLAGASSSALVTNQVSSTGVSIRYERQVPTNTEILYAVWSDKSGQDDLKWYVSDAVGAAYVEFKNHKDYGRYHLHTYARTNGQMKGLLAQTFNRVDPTAPKTQNNAKVELVDYAEHKTDFTVKVSGQADTTPISKVAVAVWSQDKGQDDLKWYTPTVTNNQANVKVNIANHSNTSDKYTVHVYTTYADGQTVGTNLGSFQITKEKPVASPAQSTTPVTKKTDAQVEVVGYEASKTNFTVKVTGQSDTENISKVAVAVWSQDKGQDDLKWYTPSVTNNQSTVTVDIKDHSNTSDKYIVHVYTTYADGQTVGTNLGSFQITKPAQPVQAVTLSTHYRGTGVYQVRLNNISNSGDIHYAVWSHNKDQDDLKWYKAEQTGTVATGLFNVNNHKDTGLYHVHAYQKQNGKMVFLANQEINVAKQNFLDMPYYNQGDNRWAYNWYGNWNMWASGCVPTSLAMIYSALTDKVYTPTELASYLYNNTTEFNKTSGVGTTGRGILVASQAYGLNTEVLQSYDSLANALKEGHYVAAAVNPSKFVISGTHELVLKGYNAGKTYVTDPANRSNNGWYDISYIWRNRSTDPVDTRGLGQPFVKITDRL